MVFDHPLQSGALQLPRDDHLPSRLQYMLSRFLALDKSHHLISLMLPIPLRCEREILLNTTTEESTRILGFPISTGPLARLSNNCLVLLFLSSLHSSFLFLLPCFGQFSTWIEWGLKLEPLAIYSSVLWTPTMLDISATGAEINMAVMLTYFVSFCPSLPPIFPSFRFSSKFPSIKL